MKRYNLDATDLSQYDGLTDAERLAWLNPEPRSYHSFHVERMGEHVFRWRDSREGNFYIGNPHELQLALLSLRPRKLDPNYNQPQITILNVLSQEEIDDFFKDL